MQQLRFVPPCLPSWVPTHRQISFWPVYMKSSTGWVTKSTFIYSHNETTGKKYALKSDKCDASKSRNYIVSIGLYESQNNNSSRRINTAPIFSPRHRAALHCGSIDKIGEELLPVGLCGDCKRLSVSAISSVPYFGWKCLLETAARLQFPVLRFWPAPRRYRPNTLCSHTISCCLYCPVHFPPPIPPWLFHCYCCCWWW